MTEIIKLKSQNILHYQGFLYYKQSNASRKTYWICRKKKRVNENI